MKLLVCGLLLVLCGCELAVNSSQADSDQEEAIVFGESIEGIQIGDDSTSIVRRLGEPSAIGIGDFNGHTLVYAVDGVNAIDVTISSDESIGIGVIQVDVSSTYGGTTEDGVGIGMLRREALEKLGSPDTTIVLSGGIRDVYHYRHNSFAITSNDTIQSISMSRPWRR